MGYSRLECCGDTADWNAVAVKSHVEKVGHIECTKDTPYEILELLP
jgi:hypothetical protein